VPLLNIFKPSIEVPFDKDAAHRFVPWIMGLMIFLATLALTGSATVSSVIKQLETTIASGFTVTLPKVTYNDDSFPGLDRERLEKVKQILRTTNGIKQTQIVSRSPFINQLDQNNRIIDQTSSPPTLIDVEIRDGYELDLTKLETTLKRDVPGTSILDHKQWRQESMLFAYSGFWVSIIVATLIGLAAIITIAFVTHTGLNVHQRIIDVLHIVGARDKYIARQFQAHALNLSLKGAVIGILLSIATLMGLNQFIGKMSAQNLLNGLPYNEIWLIILLTPLVVMILTSFSAQLTVLSTLNRTHKAW